MFSDATRALAAAIAERVAQAEAPAPVSIWVGGPDELARPLQTLIASALAERGLAVMANAATAHARAEGEAAATGAKSLVRLTVAATQNQLRLDGELFGVEANFWSGRSPLRPAHPARALQFSVKLDSDVGAWATKSGEPKTSPAAAALPTRLSLFATLPARPAALAAGDLNGDGRDEVAVLTDDEVLLFSGDGQLLARHDHRLLPRSPTPCREPFGSIAFTSQPPRILYWSARHAEGEELRWDAPGQLTAVGRLTRAPLLALEGQTVWGKPAAGATWFQAEIGMGSDAAQPVSGPFVSLARARFPEGLRTLFLSPEGRGGVSAALDRKPSVTGFGSSAALADLDGDGVPELVVSAPTRAPVPDQIRILPVSALESLPPEGDLRTAAATWTSGPVEGDVMQLVPADLDGDRRPELLLGVWTPTGGELRSLRSPR